MDHCTPITFRDDETSDIGSDTRASVSLLELRHDVPSAFTGTYSSRDQAGAMKRLLLVLAASAGLTGLILLV
jgi:hypothetical protein